MTHHQPHATAVLHALRPGTGVPLVLLHAFPLDARMWADVAALLPAGLPVLAPDLPGLGAAQGVPLPEPALEASADAVAAALAQAGHHRAVVAGLSMGGYVALALAERHPEVVAGLGLLDTKSTADTEEARANRLRVAGVVEDAGSVDEVLPMATGLLGAASRERPELVGRLEAWIGAQPPAGVAWSQRAMAARPDRTAVLEGFAGPGLVLVGEEDVPTPVAEAQRMADALGVQPVVVPDAGHLTAVEAPTRVAAALGDLVTRARA
ncbi:alpha/beta fold hydrolase [Cellulomonas endometrii]|uniref:alpha/beta fold hydrolase n=1 Tax=Cellulomonas endometrii TaxID=3036301 RepID=UPI0024AD1F2C|nr:alpha/beta hydrolase [Cellulomonas endometrii]